MTTYMALKEINNNKNLKLFYVDLEIFPRLLMQFHCVINYFRTNSGEFSKRSPYREVKSTIKSFW